MTRDRKLGRTRWVEVALTLICAGGFLWLIRSPLRTLESPGLAAAFLLLLLLGTAALNLWQYRIMDEFRRARMLKAWALTGYAGFLTLTGLIVWRTLTWPGLGLPVALARSQPLTFGLADLYLPWAAMTASLLFSTAWLYWRDMRGG